MPQQVKTSGNSEAIYRFRSYTLDLSAGTLSEGGEWLTLRRKTFALLEHLVVNSGKLLTRKDLLETLWPNLVVNEEGLTNCIYELREVLHDRSHPPRFIETVHGRGYRFIAPVVETKEPAVLLSAPAIDGSSLKVNAGELSNTPGAVAATVQRDKGRGEVPIVLDLEVASELLRLAGFEDRGVNELIAEALLHYRARSASYGIIQRRRRPERTVRKLSHRVRPRRGN